MRYYSSGYLPLSTDDFGTTSHSSKIRGLSSTKCSNERFKICYGILFTLSSFFVYECPCLSADIDKGIHKGKIKVARNEEQKFDIHNK